MNFRDCFWTVWAEFLGLFSYSMDRNFGTVFGQYRTGLRFGFDHRLMPSGFVMCLGIIIIR